ncbi:hypothetical protein EW145_g2873 [Phellinidium pouzarii]|uniref:CS domain-containing protein n=1 Tax=Phellinidium pouzarii TaxID=167371 RepID=A0A4S4L9Q8_9AGAM|nr:hypothetical protein EW145_g2873 [Phellinidium pouzarii]
MITPSFSCTQTAAAVIVRIYVPAVRASDVELHVDGSLFSVHISPYFLRLVFPGAVVEDDASSAAYDPSSGYLTVTLTKATPREYFKDLDVLAKLLAPPEHDEPKPQPIIEVIDSESMYPEPHGEEDYLAETTENLSLDQREVLQAAQNDWQLPQQMPELSPPVSISNERRYGFLNAYTGYFSHVSLTENEVNELGPDVEKLSHQERRLKRLSHEDAKWDEDYYMADYMDDEYIQEIIAYTPTPELAFSPELREPLIFTEEENAEMLRLPRKECKYLTTLLQKHDLYLTLLTILFSHVYDARTTQNDPTPESAWTICSLTPAFSALDPPPYSAATSIPLDFTPPELQNALKPSFRRALAFPLYRSFALAETCLQDVSTILCNGRRPVLRALLSTKRILDHHEVYYIYSKIWVDDLCRWVASDASDETLRKLGRTLSSTHIDKREVGWDLLELEAAAQQRIPDSDDESESASMPADSNSNSDNENENDDSVFSSSSSTTSASSSSDGDSSSADS